MDKKKKWTGILGIAAGVGTAAFFGAGSLLFDKAMKRKSRTIHNPTPYRMQSEKWALWWEKQHTEEITIVTNDGLKLYGYQLSAGSKPSPVMAVLVHGHECRAKELGFLANMYLSVGIDVFAPDLRAHGKSEGKYFTMGPAEASDLIRWIKELERRQPRRKYVLHGVSMGASTVMIACGEPDLPKSVICAVEDCGYADLKKELNHEFEKQMPKFLSKPAVFSVNAISRLRNGRDLSDKSPLEGVKKSVIPILFIHGSSDPVVPVDDCLELYAASQNPLSDIMVVDGAKHAVSYFADPDKYSDRVKKFVSDSITAVVNAD
ncbi:MAG: alpha/beta hydrolase [Oscillospiraceae bacterium]|jgi:fermentation-respiration switch protein FrsA (DUF1100 family)